MIDYHKPLLSPVAKLDIKDLIDESVSSPPRTTHSSTFSRSSSLASPHTQYSHTPSSPASCSLSHYSTNTATTSLFGPQPVHGAHQLPPQPPPPLSNTAQAVFQQNPGLNPAAASTKRPPPNGSRSSGSPNRSKGKWSPAEDAKIIVLRGRGMKWDDISKEIPGRSPISCRLHYQNYLEKRADWDEEQRNKLARVYDRLKPDLWNPIANELGVPWRACEAMHWALGEADMCRRANVLPFPLATNRPEPACAPPPSAGRVAQRDRMRGSTRVFEGHDITTITSPSFHSVNGNPQSQGPYPMSLPGIGNGQTFPGYDEPAVDIDNDADNEERDPDTNEQLLHHNQQQHEGPPVRRRRLGNNGTRLPGVAELDRSIAADFAAAAAEGGGRMVVVKQEDGHSIGTTSTRRIKLEGDRRGSTGTGVSSRRSR